jgi:UDP-N-acetylglucosamine 2-epimerase (non-hydrolysing)
MEQFGLADALAMPGLKLTPPLDYFAFQRLVANAAAVVTDSGGIQEETTFRQVPCVTLRPNTERPSTVDLGTNQLLTSFDVDAVVNAVLEPKEGSVPPLWDGAATERVVDALLHL